MRRVCRLLPVIIATLLMNISVTAAPPNVLIILTDDQGWGDLSLHGNTNLATPHIDQLARSGARFEHFYVCPVCSPTRAEMLTGRWHPRGGVRDVTSGGERLDLDETTIADSRGNRTTLLPARDAILSANLKRSSRHPNCSYITNWTTTNDSIWWNIDVPESGDFDVEILYTCDANQIGSVIELTLATGNISLPVLTATIDRPYESPLIGAAEDRVPRTESLVKDFGWTKLGTISLSPGITSLWLKANTVAAENVMDLRMLILNRRTPDGDLK